MTRAFLGLCTTVLTVGCLAAADCHAEVTVPNLFTSHAVLQRDHANRVWGWAKAGEKVTVTLGADTQSVTTGDDGSWAVHLAPLPAGGPHTMTIQGENTITLNDILIGEVWICSGQSNMQWPVNSANDADLEKATANFPQIRLISVPQVGTQEPQKNFDGRWAVCTPETVGDFSAVGYLFGRQLHQTLNVPIGLIDDAWGGSAAEAWVRRDVLEQYPQHYGPLLANWDERAKSFDFAKLTAEYQEKLATYKERQKEARQKGTEFTARPPQAPRNDMTGNQRPANIYNGVLKPTIGYGIRGCIWYQGESNAGRAFAYRHLFPLMIQSWRDEWGIGDFSFYYVQLADFREEVAAPAPSDWAELREAQTMTMAALPKTGQAVIIDIGEGKDIHPKNKQDVAKRLARWALANDYGINVPYRSPEIRGMVADGKQVRVTFDYVGSGLRTFDTANVVGFSVAGEDRQFVNVVGNITDKDTVTLDIPTGMTPVAVRYAWANNPVCNLYSSDGLPATPGRTDNWPGVTLGVNK